MPHTPPPPTPSRRAWPKRFIVLAIIYALWLVWLSYVAWVNVRSGHQ